MLGEIMKLCPMCKTWFEPDKKAQSWQIYCKTKTPSCGRVAAQQVRKRYAAAAKLRPKKPPKKPNAKCPCCGTLSYRKKYGKDMTYHYCKSCQQNLFVQQNIGNPGQEMYASW